MNLDRIKAQHLADQVWQSLRNRQSDIERILDEGSQSGDDHLIRAVLGYVLARMGIIDFDLEEE